MKFKQNYWHFLPIIDMIESYKLDSPKEFIEKLKLTLIFY